MGPRALDGPLWNPDPAASGDLVAQLDAADRRIITVQGDLQARVQHPLDRMAPPRGGRSRLDLARRTDLERHLPAPLDHVRIFHHSHAMADPSGAEALDGLAHILGPSRFAGM